jgi:repressor LexA
MVTLLLCAIPKVRTMGTWLPPGITDQEETTLKRFYREENRIRLQPENETMSPIYVDPDKLEIQGRVVAVMRQLY